MKPNKRSKGLNSANPNRKRNVQFHFWVSDEEATLIRERMARMGIIAIGAYMRKMATEGYYINLDLSSVKELVSLLRRCSNNLNQYAKKANATGSIYVADIEDLRIRLDEIWESATDILRELAGIQ